MADIDPRGPDGFFDSYACPDCGYGFGFESVEGEPHLLYCPRCDKYFEIPAEHRVEEEERRAQAGRDDELDGLRIRQLSLSRRAAYRSRSYCVIAALVCAVGAVQLAWSGVSLVRAAGWGAGATSYFLFAILAIWGAVYFTRKTAELNREAKQSTLSEPQTPPDFSTLGDGSEQWKKLEDVR